MFWLQSFLSCQLQLREFLHSMVNWSCCSFLWKGVRILFKSSPKIGRYTRGLYFFYFMKGWDSIREWTITTFLNLFCPLCFIWVGVRNMSMLWYVPGEVHSLAKGSSCISTASGTKSPFDWCCCPFWPPHWGDCFWVKTTWQHNNKTMIRK